jgi:hypothetical protein
LRPPQQYSMPNFSNTRMDVGCVWAISRTVCVAIVIIHLRQALIDISVATGSHENKSMSVPAQSVY